MLTLFEQEGGLNGSFSRVERPGLRPLPSSQEAFEDSLRDDLLIIRTVIEEAFDKMLSDIAQLPPHYHTRNTRCTRVNENIRGFLFERFPEHMHLRNGTYCLVKNGYRLHFKKLSKEHLPSFIPTRSSQRLLSQRQPMLPLENVIEQVEIFVGYVLGRHGGTIEKICAVLIEEDEVTWVTNLGDLTGGDIGTLLPIVPVSPSDDDIQVRPREQRRANQSKTAS